MATIFIKVNPKVAEHLGLMGFRPTLPDGTMLLWWKDLRAIDPDWMADKEGMMRRIGGVMLTDPQAAAEQRGYQCAKLPIATDPRFVWEAPKESEEDSEQSENTENSENSENAEQSEGEEVQGEDNAGEVAEEGEEV